MSAINKVPRPAENEFFSKFNFHTQIIAHNSACVFSLPRRFKLFKQESILYGVSSRFSLHIFDVL